jgi:hypothetical protein
MRYTKVIISTEYSMEGIRGPDHLKKYFEHMMKSVNAAIRSGFAECAQDKLRRVIDMEVRWCVDYDPRRNPDGDVGYWKVLATIDSADEKPAIGDAA